MFGKKQKKIMISQWHRCRKRMEEKSFEVYLQNLVL